MGQRNENWVHLFQILNVGKHKDGFTLYELTSMVYPKSCPDAITKIVVWKRYNEFKTLHTEIKKRIKPQNVQEPFPKLPKSSYFRRFSEQLIEDRRKAILIMLEFITGYPELFTSDVFVKFFETSYVPAHELKGNIDAIRDELHLPLPQDIISINSLSSDDDRTTCTDGDTLSTRSNFSNSICSTKGSNFQSTESLLSISSQKDEDHKIKFENLPSIPESNQDLLSYNSSLSLMSDISSLDHELLVNSEEVHYLVDAAKHISIATQFETAKNYEESFVNYKLGISCLINGAKNDSNIDRRESVRHKIAKYLLRAEKIYNVHLSLNLDDQNWNDNISKKLAESLTAERPRVELRNIKVVQIMSSVMLVSYVNSTDLFVIKAIRNNTSPYNYQNLPILPLHVPFMVTLHKYFTTEQGIFVLLQYARGGSLWKYLLDYKDKSPQEHTPDHYAELVKEYHSHKLDSSHNKENSIVSPNITSVDTNCILKSSQDLLESVSDLLHPKIMNPVVFQEKGSKVESDPILELDSDNENLSCWSEFCRKQWELPESIILKYASQLVVVLESLHRIGIICYDIQPKNLLLDDKGDLLLTYMYQWENFDTVRYPEYPETKFTAPELNLIGDITKAADWWSFGVIFYEMLTGLQFYSCHPGGFTPTTVLNIPNFVSSEAESLLRQLLVYNPEERLGFGINGAENIKSHKFFHSIRWESVYKQT